MASKFALIIGNSDYQDSRLRGLTTPGQDAEQLAKILSDPNIGGFDYVTSLINEIESNVRREIGRFVRNRKRDDLLLIYFSGHGILDELGVLHFALKDTEYDNLSATSLPSIFVHQEMDRSHSRRQVLILDCCHSGAFGRTKGTMGMTVDTAAAFQSEGFGRIILTATDAIQYAWEGDQVTGNAEMSIFTRVLVEGLRSGTADMNHDGYVDVDELYDYIFAQVRKNSSKMTPQRFIDKQEGRIIIARSPRPVVVVSTQTPAERNLDLSEPSDEAWNKLLIKIKDGRCTPIIGPGVCLGVFPSASEIAQEWAQEYDLPLDDYRDLAQVAQLLSASYDTWFPQKKLVRILDRITPPDFTIPDEPHGVLADLPFPIYITTNFDDFMSQALKSRDKTPRQEVCLWHKRLKRQFFSFENNSDFNPTPAEPLVFHLHGYSQVPESIVLTEDDYPDFLVNISEDPDVLPKRIVRALAGTSLLFIGYSYQDRSFRELFRYLQGFLERTISRGHWMQLAPSDSIGSSDSTPEVKKYLAKYFRKDLPINMGADQQLFWGTAREFAAELRQRWVSLNAG